jgi:tRNA (adenine57-N1/adenine58-N1)-methyltransferase
VTVLVVHDDREYLLVPGETFECDLGVLELPDDVAPGDTVETHLGEPFVVRELRGPDLFQHFERTGAPMVPRDIGRILGYTGIAAGDRVLDAGTGTGVLAAYLGRLGAEVVTYETDAEAAATARENMALAGVADTVDVREGDVTDHLDDVGTVDHITLDTADAATVVERAPDVLAPGGFVASYTPFVEDVREVDRAARDAGLTDVQTVETIERRMDFDERGSRPATAPVGHTGYLLFARAGY